MTATDKHIPRVTITDECIAAYNQLRSGRGTPKPKFIIYKVSDDTTTIVLEESSPETDYEVFLQKLSSAVDKDGNPAPRYAVYDVEYDLGSEGKRYEQFIIKLKAGTVADHFLLCV
jgi:cofilin